MSDQQNWRTETDAGDYFLHQQKRLALADRRPVIRQASDLVGPGIASGAVRITDYNDILATFNGYYSSAPGAANAPPSNEAFVGYVVSDDELGGTQVFTGLTTGNEYRRTFTRSPVDPQAIGWGAWGGQRVLPTLAGQWQAETPAQYGQITTLTAPGFESVGDPSVFERSTSGFRIRRQGVYTGVIEVGSYTYPNPATVYVQRPFGATSVTFAQLAIDIGSTTQIPLTFYAVDGNQAVSVSVLHNTGTPGTPTQWTTCWYRINLTRLGDAV